MTTYYVGYRPVLQGDNTNNWINTYTSEVGVYSNWSLMSTSDSVLTGFPDNEYTLGTVKHARILEYIYAGGRHIAPMSGAGGGERLDYARLKMLEYKGTVPAFPSGYGHAQRSLYYGNYNNYVFDGVTSADVAIGTGHAHRINVSYGGAFEPYTYKGVTDGALYDGGQANTESDYGRNKINEWAGVPSAKAL